MILKTERQKFRHLFMIIPFFVPNIFGILEELKQIDDFFYYWRLVSMILIVLYFLYSALIDKILPSNFTVIVILLNFTMFLSTFLNNGDLFLVTKISTQIIAFVIYIDIAVKRGRYNLLVKYMFYILLILSLANLFSLVLYPNLEITSTSSWVFGSKNNHFFVLIPLLFLSAMYDFIRKNKLAYAFLFSFLITLLTFIINNSDTSLIALMVIGIGVLFHKIVILNKIFNFKLMFGVSFFISSFFILDYFTQPLRLLIEYLGKVNTFGRFDLWKDSLYYLSIKPFLGYGIEYDDVIIEKFGYAQTHNRYLDTAYIGGLLGLVIFMVLLFYINKKLERDRKSRIGKIITILYSAYFVSYITETKRLDVLMFGIMLLTIYAVKQNYYYRSVEKNGV